MKLTIARILSAEALAFTSVLTLPLDVQIGPQSSLTIARYHRDQGLQEAGNISSSHLQSLGPR